MMYHFCKENEDYANSLVERLKKNSNPHSVWGFGTWTEKEQNSKVESPQQTGSTNLFAEKSDTNTNTQFTSSDRSTLDSVHSGKRLLSSQSDDQPVTKKIKLEESCEKRIMENVIHTQQPCALSKLNEQAVKLCEGWLTEDNTRDIVLNDIFLCPPEELDNIFQVLNLSGLPEKALSTACNDLISKYELVSYCNSQHFIKDALFLRISNMTQSASRLLTTTLSDLINCFPNQVIEAVLVPCISDISKLENYQAELFVKVIKTCLSEVNSTQLLKLCISNCSEINDHIILIYHPLIIQSKGTLDQQTLQKMLSVLSNSAPMHNKNLKFGKMIMDVIRIYGKKIKGSDFGLLSHIVETHKSFLQKSLKSALQKLG